MKNLLLLCLALGMSNGAWAKDSVEEQFIQKFSACDGSLFEFIHASQKALAKYAPIERKNGIAYFKTTDNGERSTVTFKKPMKVGGVTFTGFYQEYTPLPLGFPPSKDNTIHVYFWGLNTTDKPDELAKRLPQLQLTAQSNGHWAGTTWIIEQADKSTTWQVNDNATGGSAPVKGSVEKLLFVEEYQGKTTLTCTLQGYTNERIVQAVRPDLQGK